MSKRNPSQRERTYRHHRRAVRVAKRNTWSVAYVKQMLFELEQANIHFNERVEYACAHIGYRAVIELKNNYDPFTCTVPLAKLSPLMQKQLSHLAERVSIPRRVFMSSRFGSYTPQESECDEQAKATESSETDDV